MSRSTSLILAAILGGAVVGVIVWFARPQPAMPSAPAVSQPSPVAAAPAVTAKPAAGATASAPQPELPPWAAGAGGGTPAAGGGLAGALDRHPVDPGKAAGLARIRARMTQLTAQGRHPTPAEMNDVLGDLEKVEGSSVVAGVDIGALRQNLVRVDEMRKLGEELKVESQKPGGGDKQKVNRLLARLQQLQSQMNLNLTVASPATTAR